MGGGRQIGIVNAVLFPPPSIVAVAVLDWIRSGQFFWDLGASLYRVVAGFTMGAIMGVVLRAPPDSFR